MFRKIVIAISAVIALLLMAPAGASAAPNHSTTTSKSSGKGNVWKKLAKCESGGNPSLVVLIALLVCLTLLVGALGVALEARDFRREPRQKSKPSEPKS